MKTYLPVGEVVDCLLREHYYCDMILNVLTLSWMKCSKKQCYLPIGSALRLERPLY